MQEERNVAVVRVADVPIGPEAPFAFLGGPCVIESEESTLRHAARLKEITRRVGVGFVFKSSFDKANRMRLDSPRGPGLEAGIAILARVRREIGVPVLTDVHTPEQAARAAACVDLLQVPAMLCRQTDLVVACARTGKPVNLKKGQFMAPQDMEHIAAKVTRSGNSKVLITERGTTFGYGDLVADMRSIPILKSMGFPVVFDAGHSVQRPGALGGRSGGSREMIPVLARAAIAAGADALFLECHENPDAAQSDGPNMLPLDQVEPLLEVLKKIHAFVRA